jgi:type I restriction enzyme R subunit
LLITITPEKLKEKSFQKLIKEYLIEENGYIEGDKKDYNKHYAIDTKQLFKFLEETQPQTLNKLRKIYGNEYKTKILDNLQENLARKSMIEVIKKGIKDFGETLKFAYFKPPTTFNTKLNNQYQNNIFSVTEEVNHSGQKELDIVIFLNGLPIITMELKNRYSNPSQTYEDAIEQYQTDRSPNELMFQFKKRSIVNFAVDNEEVYMTTELKNEDTFFLPFNRGKGNGKLKGAGNPEVKDKVNTFYLWEKILKKDMILEILKKYVFIDVDKDEDNNIKSEKLIFPRYHQLEVVSKLLEDVKENKSGVTYLIQHSAGSGKTYSITWLTHRLSDLHDEEDKVIFDSVIVVSDRLSLDTQLQDTIEQINHEDGLIEPIKTDSNQLADAITDGTKIIITTIQKFPYILDKVSDTKDKRYAIIIDEAHSSTAGKNMLSLKESLSLEEAAEQDEIISENIPDVEDKINEKLSQIQDMSTLSIFGFTATPKQTTLKLFGTKNKDGQFEAFHVYSMKQAIEEKFILDVLTNYTPYSTYFKINKKIEEDPMFEKSKASKEVLKGVEIHPNHLKVKTRIIIEHFREKIQNMLNGEAKAMVVTSSRLHAVRYGFEFRNYIKEQGYDDLGVLVAFSSSVEDNYTGDLKSYTEAKMNGFPDTQTEDRFDTPEYQLLIVAKKYQTGFDQPKLCAMYVDKTLRGVNAVQTLSRLNRTYPGKEEPFVLDFMNDPEDIKSAFEDYYKVTRLNTENLNPNDIYILYEEILDERIIDLNDVEKFVRLFFEENGNKTKILENGLSHLKPALKRIRNLEEEERLQFRSKLKKFKKLYLLLIQIYPIQDVDLHQLNIYIKYLVNQIEVNSVSTIEVSDKITLEYLRVESQGEQRIDLDEGEGLDISLPGSVNVSEEEKERFSIILEKINERFQTDFTDEDKIEQIKHIQNSIEKDERLNNLAKENSFEDWKLMYEEDFENKLVKSYYNNKEFYEKVLNNKELLKYLRDSIAREIYSNISAN